MRIEREISAIHVPSWYPVALHGTVVGVLLATLAVTVLIGWWGLLTLVLLGFLVFFRFVDFESRRFRIVIDGSFSILGSDAVDVAFSELRVRERRGSILEVSFPYKGKRWIGVVAHKDDSSVLASDDPALYARIRATLRSR